LRNMLTRNPVSEPFCNQHDTHKRGRKKGGQTATQGDPHTARASRSHPAFLQAWARRSFLSARWAEVRRRAANWGMVMALTAIWTACASPAASSRTSLAVAAASTVARTARYSWGTSSRSLTKSAARRRRASVMCCPLSTT
jgi:hypothetical protein